MGKSRIMKVHPLFMEKMGLYKKFFGKNLNVNLDNPQMTRIMESMLPSTDELREMRIEEYRKRKRRKRRIIFEI